MRPTLTKLFAPKIAVFVSAAYLLVAAGSLLLPRLTSSTLAGVWSILFALPWSALFPVGAVSESPAGEMVGSILIALGMVLNAVLLYAAVRWVELRFWTRAR
jgi:hypothetical protein